MHAGAVGSPRIPMDDPRAVTRVDVESWRVGHERETLLWCLERRQHATFRRREADDPGVAVRRRKGQEDSTASRSTRTVPIGGICDEGRITRAGVAR
jgi:hypothetical protein